MAFSCSYVISSKEQFGESKTDMSEHWWCKKKQFSASSKEIISRLR